MNAEWEEQLRRTLARVEAPEGFCEKVVNRLPARAHRKPRYYGIAAAAAVAALAWVGQTQWERAKKQAESRDAIFALELAAEKLSTVQKRLANSAVTIRFDKEQLKQ